MREGRKEGRRVREIKRERRGEREREKVENAELKGKAFLSFYSKLLRGRNAIQSFPESSFELLFNKKFFTLLNLNLRARFHKQNYI